MLIDTGFWEDLTETFKFKDITYHKAKQYGMVRIAFNRPDCRNAFRPLTVDELIVALQDAQHNTKVGVILLTGNGPSSKDGEWAFSSGGDQRVRGKDGYEYIKWPEDDPVDWYRKPNSGDVWLLWEK